MRAVNGKALAANQCEAWFAGNLLGGGMSIECQNCKYISNLSDVELVNDMEVFCDDCGWELLYPDDVEW